MIRHPVLSIEQDVAVERSVRPALQVFCEGTIENFDTVGTSTYRFKMRLLKVGRQRTGCPVRIGTSESLPGKIIIVEAEVAGQTLDPVAQHCSHVRGAGGQGGILGGRNSKAIERHLPSYCPTDQRLIEQGRQ